MARHPQGNGSHGELEVLGKGSRVDGDAFWPSRSGLPETSRILIMTDFRSLFVTAANLRQALDRGPEVFCRRADPGSGSVPFALERSSHRGGRRLLSLQQRAAR